MEPFATGSQLFSIIANFPKVQETALKALSLLGGKKVLVLGCGGTGKTSFCELLSPNHSRPSLDYTESLIMDSYDLSISRRSGKLEAYPGQPSRLDESWKEIDEKIVRGYYCGIIYVTSYGFHNLRVSIETYNKFKELNEFNKDQYLSDNRRDEIRVLRKLKESIKHTKQKIWTLSLVTKEDLWFPGRSDVEIFYCKNEEYTSAINDIKNFLLPNKFKHEYAYVSTLSRRFEDTEGVVIQNISEEYDETNRVESMHRLFKTLLILLEW